MNYCDAQDCKGLVHRTSLRLYRELPSLRASLEFDDFEQEMWLEWVRVHDRFDPTKGYAFSTFLGTCCRNRAIKMVKRKRLRREYDSEKFLEARTDPGAMVEEVINNRQVSRAIAETLDPRIQQIVRFLTDEPEALMREAKALALKTAMNVDRDRAEDQPVEITLPMLFKLLGLSRSQGYRLIAKMKDEMDELQQ